MAAYEMRAAHIKENLASLPMLGDERGRAARARLDPALVQRIESETRLSWLPLDCDVQLTAAVAAEAGELGVYEWSREAMRRTAVTPLLGPLFRGAVGLFGLSPLGAFRWVQSGWDSIYRGCGRWTHEPSGEGSLVLLHHDAPPPMRRPRTYRLGIAGAFHGVIDVFGYTGSVTTPEPREDEATVRYELQWRAK